MPMCLMLIITIARGDFITWRNKPSNRAQTSLRDGLYYDNSRWRWLTGVRRASSLPVSSSHHYDFHTSVGNGNGMH